MMGVLQGEHVRLDAAVHSRMLTKIGFMTLGEAAATTGLTRATFARVRDGEVSDRIDVSGLTAAVIEDLYRTTSGVALRCLMAEHDLRMADLNLSFSSEAIGLIPKAEALVASIKATSYTALDQVDQLALSSLEAQIALYKARHLTLASEKEVQFRAAFRTLDSQTAAIVRLMIYGEQTSDADKLVGLRMLLNKFFAAWELDEIADETKRLPLAKGVAATLCQRDFLRKAGTIAKMLRDPRLSYQLAEAAALVGQHRAAANLLAESMLTTGHDPHDPRGWAPLWLTVRITNEPHFQEPIAILEHTLI